MKTRSLSILAIAIAGLSLAGCLPKADFKVSLRVLDEETGKPIRDALVFVAARSKVEPPRDSRYNDAIVAARGKTDSKGVARLSQVQGFYWINEPQDKLWKMLESRKPKDERMVASIEGGDILVFARDYGVLHHPFGIKDSPEYQSKAGQGKYNGLVGRNGFKGENTLIEVTSGDLKERRELVVRMRKPESPDYVVENALTAVAASTRTWERDDPREVASPETKKWFVSPNHGWDGETNHDTVIHEWTKRASGPRTTRRGRSIISATPRTPTMR